MTTQIKQGDKIRINEGNEPREDIAGMTGVVREFIDNTEHADPNEYWCDGEWGTVLLFEGEFTVIN